MRRALERASRRRWILRRTGFVESGGLSAACAAASPLRPSGWSPRYLPGVGLEADAVYETGDGPKLNVKALCVSWFHPDQADLGRQGSSAPAIIGERSGCGVLSDASARRPDYLEVSEAPST